MKEEKTQASAAAGRNGGQSPQHPVWRFQTARKIIFGVVWLAIILAVIWNRDKLTVDGILNFTPENPWLAALVMLSMFALKSISMVFYSGILFVADGMLFPLPVAIGVNILGTAIMITIPYWIGKRMGASGVAHIQEKYPKVQRLSSFRVGDDFLFSMILRIIGIVPCEVVSLYLGAIELSYPKYLAGGLMGILPAIVLYPIMGMGIKDIHAPQFWIALGIKGVLMVGSAVGTWLYERRKRKSRGPAA